MPDARRKTANIAQLDGHEDFRTFQNIEALHRAQLSAGALAQMPAGFLANFYRYLATRTDCALFAAETQGRMAGFVAGTLHAPGLLKSFLLAEPLPSLGYGLRLLGAPRLFFRIVSLARQLGAGGRKSDMDERQLLSIAVDPADLRSGVGSGLFSALRGWFRSHAAEDFGVIAAKTQTAALHFYKRCGAAEIAETKLGGLSSIRFRYVLRSEFLRHSSQHMADRRKTGPRFRRVTPPCAPGCCCSRALRPCGVDVAADRIEFERGGCRPGAAYLQMTSPGMSCTCAPPKHGTAAGRSTAMPLSAHTGTGEDATDRSKVVGNRDMHSGFQIITNLLRLSLTYILPAAITGAVILWGMWIVPDSLYGMYGNIDGRWGSWSARSILEWSTFLDFGPYSPLTGTGSLLLPNLPWLNPGALALAIPVPLEYKHLFSYVIYLAELTASLYILFRELDIEPEYAFVAILLYLSFFFLPFNSVTGAWHLYSLGPFYCHQFAAMNLATVAFLRFGLSTFRLNLVWGLVFIACLFIAFSSAPISNLFYVPVYAMLWAVLLLGKIERHAFVFRFGLLLLTLAVFSIIGLPNYMLASAAVSARDNAIPPFLHPGMALLTLEYWVKLISRFPACSGEQGYVLNVLICPLSMTPVAWVQIAALIGGAVMIVFDRGRRRALAIAVICMIALLHFYFLLDLDEVLGRVGILGYHYIYWTLYPLLFAVPITAIATLVRLGTAGPLSSATRWIPAVASAGISIVCLIIFVEIIIGRQPPMAGATMLGLRPIAHAQVHKGPIHQYLEQHIALAPGKPFAGYVGLHLAREDGFVRKQYMSSSTSNLHLGQSEEVARRPFLTSNSMGHQMYLYARHLLSTQFGNMFQLTDLWNSDIPTLEDYGQWLTKQMFVFNVDLLADPEDFVNPTGTATHLYKFTPGLLAMLGVRYVVSDGKLDHPSVTEVLAETSPAETTLRLYEIHNANFGNWSPTNAVVADGYGSAVSSLEKMQPDSVILLEPMPLPPHLFAAERAQLIVTKGGYRITARSTGASILILPVQFSHCWQLMAAPENTGSIFRANMVQTGIVFLDRIDAELRFEFGLQDSNCRRQDADDMYKYFSASRSGKVRFGNYATPPDENGSR